MYFPSVTAQKELVQDSPGACVYDVSVYMSVCTRVCLYIHVHVYMYVYICILYVCIHNYVYMYTTKTL